VVDLMPSAGYSGTPLPKKLGIKAGAAVAFVNADDGFASLLEPMPDDVTIRRQLRGPLDLVVLFTTERAELERRWAGVAKALTPAGALWVAWPKKSSGVTTDLTENVVRDTALARGMVDVKVCAIDDIWSGLKMVVRLKDRADRAKRSS
jgi:hypothetical protein